MSWAIVKSVLKVYFHYSLLVCKNKTDFLLPSKWITLKNYMYELFTWTYVYLCTCLVPEGAEEGVRFPGSGVTNTCEMTRGCWKRNPDPLWEQLLLFLYTAGFGFWDFVEHFCIHVHQKYWYVTFFLLLCDYGLKCTNPLSPIFIIRDVPHRDSRFKA